MLAQLVLGFGKLFLQGRLTTFLLFEIGKELFYLLEPGFELGFDVLILPQFLFLAAEFPAEAVYLIRITLLLRFGTLSLEVV